MTNSRRNGAGWVAWVGVPFGSILPRFSWCEGERGRERWKDYQGRFATQNFNDYLRISKYWKMEKQAQTAYFLSQLSLLECFQITIVVLAGVVFSVVANQFFVRAFGLLLFTISSFQQR